RYTGRRGWIRQVSGAAAGGVRFFVQDTGPRITVEEQAFICDRFYKMDRARTRTTAGSGTGLAIVSELVTAMGGEVGLDSRPGQGATFWFTLPIADTVPAVHASAMD